MPAEWSLDEFHRRLRWMMLASGSVRFTSLVNHGRPTNSGTPSESRADLPRDAWLISGIIVTPPFLIAARLSCGEALLCVLPLL
jgi:hypothetical protein